MEYFFWKAFICPRRAGKEAGRWMRGPKEGLLSQFLALGPMGKENDSSPKKAKRKLVQAAALLPPVAIPALTRVFLKLCCSANGPFGFTVTANHGFTD